MLYVSIPLCMNVIADGRAVAAWQSPREAASRARTVTALVSEPVSLRHMRESDRAESAKAQNSGFLQSVAVAVP